MTLPTLVLDANVLGEKLFLKWLRAYGGRAVVPPVAFAEAAVGFLRAGKTTADLLALLGGTGIRVVRMDVHDASAGAEMGFEVGDWSAARTGGTTPATT